MSMTSTSHEHDRAVTALFDTRAAAEKAKADVMTAGVPADAASITEGQTTGTTGTTAKHEEGFWGSLKNLFAPEEDRYAYAEGLRRGGFLLTVYTSEADYDRVISIIDADGAVDMHERESAWRSEGWTGYQSGQGAGTSTAATGTVGSSTAAMGTVAMGTAAVGTAAMGTGATTGTRSTERTTLDRAPASANVGAMAGTAGEETIALAEERLRVGKRDVNHGRVRLRSYVVEKNVSETVNLHSERVDVSRRPVDRAIAAGENLFQERTISAEEHDEEAVVSKDARVVEEVSLGKVMQDRAQEIHDTVRRTEVEIEDGRTGHVAGLAGASAGAMGAAGGEIGEHMEVLASDGTHVGTVDHLDGIDKIKLTKSDSADGRHHVIPRSWVSRVDSHVHLTKTAAEVRSGWTAL